jgi:hypothetical protein
MAAFQWQADFEPQCQLLILLLQLHVGQRTSGGGERNGKVWPDSDIAVGAHAGVMLGP